MKSPFPKLPDYRLSWRSIQIEPIAHSGERISVGAIVKGEDQSLIVAPLVPVQKLEITFGEKFGRHMGEALQFCVDAAEKFYSKNLLSCDWVPPLERFYLGNEIATFVNNIDEGLWLAATHSSSLSFTLHAEQ